MQLDTNAVLAWGGILSFIGLGLWGFAQFISGAVNLYCDMAGQRAKGQNNG